MKSKHKPFTVVIRSESNRNSTRKGSQESQIIALNAEKKIYRAVKILQHLYITAHGEL